MALVDQILRVRFGVGVDTEPDDKGLPAGRPTRLENATFSTPTVIEKRRGHDALTRRSIVDLSEASGALDVWSNGSSLYRHDGRSNVLSYTDGGWQFLGKMRSPTVDSVRRAASTIERWNGDIVYSGSIALMAWEQAQGVYASAIDGTTGAPMFGPKLLGAGHTRPRVANCGTQMHVYWYDGDEINVAVFNPFDRATSWAALTGSKLTSDVVLNASASYDVIAYNGGTIVGYPTINDQTKVANVAPVGYVANETSAFSRPAAVQITGSAPTVGPALATSNGLLFVAQWDYVKGLAGTVLDASSFSTGSYAFATLDGTCRAADGYACLRVTVECERERGDTAYTTPRATVFYELTSSDGTQTRSLTFGVKASDSSVSKSSNGTTMYRTRIAGRPYAIDGDVYCPVMNTEPTQQTVHLVDSNAVPIGRALQGIASPLQSGTVPAWSRAVDGTDRILLGSRLIVPSSLTGTNAYTDRGLTELSVDWRASASLDWVSRDGYVMVGGGQVNLIDGGSVTELGFGVYPEGVTLTPVSSALGTTMAAGTYLYRPTYEWSDAYGNHHHSPGVPITVTISNPNNSISVSAPTPQLTAKGRTLTAPSQFGSGQTYTNGSVKLALWRTSAGGTVYHRADLPTAPLTLNSTSNFQTFTDATPDSTLLLAELDPVTTDVQDFAPPACRHLGIVGERIMLAGLEGTPNEVWFSKLNVDGDVGPSFSAFRTFSVPSAGGGITGISQLDEHGIIFKGDRVYRFEGNGPEDAINDASSYSVPVVLNSDDGCVDSRSIVQLQGQAAQGVMFKSSRGWRLLDRGGNITDIGAPVSAHRGLQVAGADREPGSNRVRITTRDGLALVYDTRFGQWSTYTGVKGVGSCVWRDGLTFLRSDGTVFVQATGSWYADGTRPYNMLIELGWVNWGGMQDRGRVRSAHLLGRYLSPHKLRFEVAYDYRDVYGETHTADTQRFIRGTGYGAGGYGGMTRTTGIDVLSDSTFTASDENNPTVTVSIPSGTYSTGSMVTTIQPQLPSGWVFGIGGSPATASFMYPNSILQLTWGTATGLRDSLGYTGDAVDWPSTAVPPLPNGSPFTGSAVAVLTGSYVGPAYGGQADPTYRLRVDLRKQRASAVRFRISDVITGSLGGASLTLSELALTVAVEPGQARTKRIRRPG